MGKQIHCQKDSMKIHVEGYGILSHFKNTMTMGACDLTFGKVEFHTL